MVEVDRSPRVLLVEDDQIVALSLAAALKGDGFDVRAYFSAEDALAACEIWRPQIVVTDLQLPGISGLELIESLRGIVPSSLCFLISGSIASSASLESSGGELGGITILPKPFTPALLSDHLWRRAGNPDQRTAEPVDFPPITAEEMGFALELFFRIASGQVRPERRVIETGRERATLLGSIRYNRLAFRYEAVNTASQMQMYTAFRHLWHFHEGDPKQRAICARVLVFHLLMERTSGALVEDWTTATTDHSDFVVLDAVVIAAMSQIRLNARWLTSDNLLLQQIYAVEESLG